MKRITSAVGLLAISIAILTACKKGENDPFMSLKTRKARLCQEWELKEGFFNWSNSSNGTINTNNTTYANGKEINEYNNGQGSTGTSTKNYTKTITFKKDHTYTMEIKSSNENGYHNQLETGSWSFLDKSKEGDIKNKEAIHIFPTKHTSTYSYNGQPEMMDEDTYADDVVGAFLYINRLANKELIFENKVTTKSSNSEFINHSKEIFKRK